MKTAFKRVALVAAAALAIGGVSAVSANATVYSEALSLASATASVSAGTTASVVVTDTFLPSAAADATSATAFLISSPAGNAVLPTVSTTVAQNTANTATNSTVTEVGSNQNATVTATSGSLATTGVYTLSLVNPTVSGTYVVKIIPGNTNTAAVTWTVTVAAKAPITAASSTLTSTPTALSAPYTQGTPAGSIAFAANNSTANADAATVSATVSGPGLISFTTFAAAGRAISQSVANNNGTINVFADGTAGTGTITISSGTTVLGTVSVIFYGTPAKISVSVIKPVVLVGGATVDAISVSETDSNGNAIPAAGFGTIALTSDATGSIASSITGQDTTSTGCSTTVVCYSVTAGATAGTGNLTVTDTTGSTVITAAPVAVRASTGTVTTATFTTDSASYPAGGVGTLTLTLSNAAGPVPAGTYAVFTGQATSSLAFVTGTLPGAAIANTAVAPAPSNAVALGSVVVGNNGTATVTFNAPLSDGTASVTATAAATTITVVPASFTVSSGSSDAANAATDAANEATDAANAATDAANAAADSADAATAAAQDAGDKADAALAAVTALSQQVTTLLAKVAALAATIAKIAKKVKA